MNFLSALLLFLGSVAAFPTGFSKMKEIFRVNQVKSLSLVAKPEAIGDLYSGAYTLTFSGAGTAFISMLSNEDGVSPTCATLGVTTMFSGFSQLTDTTPFPNPPVVYQGTATCIQTTPTNSRYQLGFLITTLGAASYTVYAALDSDTNISNPAGFFAIMAAAYTMNGIPVAFTQATP